MLYHKVVGKCRVVVFLPHYYFLFTRQAINLIIQFSKNFSLLLFLGTIYLTSMYLGTIYLTSMHPYIGLHVKNTIPVRSWYIKLIQVSMVNIFIPYFKFIVSTFILRVLILCDLTILQQYVIAGKDSTYLELFYLGLYTVIQQAFII